MAEFRVTTDGLNLRREPIVNNTNKLAVLHTGQRVELLEGMPNAEWWHVSTMIGGREVKGWVARRYLSADFTEPPAAPAIRRVHLKEGRPEVTRNALGSAWAYPLGEPGAPRRKGTTAAQRTKELASIIDWLQVEKSLRYKKNGSTTYCNIYATDYSYLANAYLPRVWWTGSALAKLGAGQSVTPTYGATVQEMTANQLYEWLDDFGADFGWTRVFDPQEIQEAANAGSVGILCAQRKELNRPGHITAIVPETGEHPARRAAGKVTVPLQSQAGMSNFRYRSMLWWTTPNKYRAFGYWYHQ
ncbi:MAG: SH3 domain-containing protein [Gemmatimonadota bacterium]